VLLLTGGRAAAFVVTFFIPVLLVRVLDPAEFGTYRQIFLIHATLYSIAQLGMAESLFYFLPRDPERGGRYVANSLLALACMGGICAALLALARPGMEWWFRDSELPRHAFLLGFYILATMISTVMEIVLVARRRFTLASVSYACSDATRAALLLAPVALAAGLAGLMAGAAAFAALRLGVTFVYLRREFGSDLRPDVARLREQAAYALPFALAVSIEILQAHFHQYAVALKFDAATFAIYSVGCLQIPLVDLLASPAGNVAMVRMGGELRQGRPAAVVPIWHESTRWLALLIFPLVGLLLVTAPDLIRLLFTPQYQASVPLFRIWCLGILCVPLMADSMMRVHGDVRSILAIHAARLFLVAASIGWALAFLGLQGAVAVSVVSVFAGNALALARIRRRIDVRWGRLLPWSDLGAGLGVTAASAWIASRIGAEIVTEGPVRLLAVGLTFTVVYGSLTWVLAAGRGERWAGEFRRLALGAARLRANGNR
jgi:O-antigen/teichoic acid export membrane protein